MADEKLKEQEWEREQSKLTFEQARKAFIKRHEETIEKYKEAFGDILNDDVAAITLINYQINEIEALKDLVRLLEKKLEIYTSREEAV